MIRARSKQSLCKGGNVNYYQMKRDLEKKIDSQESELLRGELSIIGYFNEVVSTDYPSAL